jgi:hypothetical protein
MGAVPGMTLRAATGGKVGSTCGVLEGDATFAVLDASAGLVIEAVAGARIEVDAAPAIGAEMALAEAKVGFAELEAEGLAGVVGLPECFEIDSQ